MQSIPDNIIVLGLAPGIDKEAVGAVPDTVRLVGFHPEVPQDVIDCMPNPNDRIADPGFRLPSDYNHDVYLESLKAPAPKNCGPDATINSFMAAFDRDSPPLSPGWFLPPSPPPMTTAFTATTTAPPMFLPILPGPAGDYDVTPKSRKKRGRRRDS